MRRRDFIVVLGAVSFRSAARAQQPSTQIVGILDSGLIDPTSSVAAAFLQGMREVGYIVGQNVSVEAQYAADQYDRLPALAESLVDRHVSVIVATDVVSAHAAKAVACRSIDEVRAGHQPQDRESARPDDPTVCPGAS